MPFDGLLYQQTQTQAKLYYQRRQRRRYTWQIVRRVTMVCVCGGIMEFALPGRGPLTLLVYGPTTVQQNIIGYFILRHTKQLRFTVNGHLYDVRTPDHDLSSEEQAAWLGFAKWRGLPIYSVDGPMAIDP